MDMSESILSDEVILYEGRNYDAQRKGIRLKFLNRKVAAGGNANEPGDIGGSLEKSSLFFLTVFAPWNRFSRR